MQHEFPALKRLRSIGASLTAPQNDLPFEDRRPAQLLASLFLAASLFSFVAATLGILTNQPGTWLLPRDIGALSNGLVLALLYARCRKHYSRHLIYPAVFFLMTSLFVGALVTPDGIGVNSLYYFSLILIFSTPYLTRRDLYLLALIQVMLCLILGITAPGTSLGYVISDPLTYQLVLVGLSVVMANHFRHVFIEREARYQSLVENIRDIVYEHTLAGELLSINAEVEAVLGWQRDELLGRLVQDFVHPADVPRLYRTSKVVLTGRVSPLFELRIRTRSGDYVWMEFKSTPRIEHGEVVSVQAVGRDITQRKDAEAALHKSTQIYRALFEQTNDAVFIMSLDGIYLDVNQRGAEMLGYRTDELIAQHRHISTSGDEVNKSDTVIADLLAGKTLAPYERIFRRKDGTLFTGEVNVSLVRDTDSQPMHVQAVVRDITQRKQAEAALQESTQVYRALFEQTNDAVFIIDLQGRVKSANQRALDLTRRSTDDIVGQPYIGTVAPQEREQSQVNLNKLIAGETLPVYERLIMRKDETVFPVEINAALVRDADGRPIHIQSVMRDITERKQAEIALQKSIQVYKALFEQTNDAISIIDLEGRYLSANQRALDLTGRRLDEIIGQPFLISVAPQERGQGQNTLQRLLAGETLPVYERLVTHKDGTIFPVEINATLVRDGDGRPIHIQSVVRDITERKRHDEAMRVSEERLELALRGADMGLWDWHIETGEMFYNERWAEILGYSLGELEYYSSSWEGRVHPDDLGNVLGALDAHLSGQASFFEAEYRLLAKDGTWRWVLDRGRVTQRSQEGVPMRITGTHLDITERKQAEEALRTSETRYRSLFESSPVALLEQDFRGIWNYMMELEQQGETDFRYYFRQHPEAVEEAFARMVVVDVNQATVRTYEASSKEDVINRRGLRVTDDNIEGLIDELIAIHRGLSAFEKDSRSYTFTGKPLDINVRWSVTPQYEDLARVVVSIDDITARKQAEDQNLKLALERDRLGLMSRFLLAVSHDFRNSLASIETSRYLIDRALNGGDRSMIQPKLEIIGTSVARLAEQIENLNAVSALADLRTGRCDVNQVVKDVINEVTRHAQGKEQTVIYEPTPDEPAVLVDQAELARAVRHIFDNAVNYTPPKGTITVRTYQQGDEVRIAIKDTGIGIAPEHLPHVFDLFYRADAARSLSSGGIGLGLSVAQMVVGAHGGRIEVDSVVRSGTTFTVILPAFRQV